MSVIAKELIKAKNFPNHIANHQIFKTDNKIEKVFPSIGLSNCEENIVIDNSKEAQQAAKILLENILVNMQNRSAKIDAFCKNLKKFTDKRKSQVDFLQFLLQAIIKQLSQNADQFITMKKNKISLNIPETIIGPDKKVLVKKGEGLFKLCNKIDEFLAEAKLAKLKSLEAMPSFKTFSSVNISQQQTKIVFSSDGIDGAWDIATMSERGIQSCQSWNGGHSNCLVGSIVDPCVGIIYITNGQNINNRGSKMNRRCVVRVALDDNKKPFITLDRMYPAYDMATAKTFKDFISKKVGNKLRVVYSPDAKNLSKAIIPEAPIVKMIGNGYRSYQDTPIPAKVGYLKLKRFIKENYTNITNKSSTPEKQDNQVASQKEEGILPSSDEKVIQRIVF